MNISIFKKGSIKESRIPESEQKAHVEEKKDLKQKDKPDVKVESINEEDYSKIEIVIKY